MLSQALRSKSALTRVIATTALPAASLTVAAKASGFRVETIRAGDGKNFPKVRSVDWFVLLRRTCACFVDVFFYVLVLRQLCFYLLIDL